MLHFQTVGIIEVKAQYAPRSLAQPMGIYSKEIVGFSERRNTTLILISHMQNLHLQGHILCLTSGAERCRTIR